ncbi:MAG TPA: hypothetical protein VFU06_11655 [Longimicrobiales bacterium]|nr:hypothetical protein [Longimicrobiales bacterium]
MARPLDIGEFASFAAEVVERYVPEETVRDAPADRTSHGRQSGSADAPEQGRIGTAAPIRTRPGRPLTR